MADDSPFARRFVRTCLTRLGVDVHEADDGDVAQAFLRDRRVDMLVTGLNMVRMHGDELCLKVRGELELTELPVISRCGSWRAPRWRAPSRRPRTRPPPRADRRAGPPAASGAPGRASPAAPYHFTRVRRREIVPASVHSRQA